jgi:hypothetical protein
LRQRDCYSRLRPAHIAMSWRDRRLGERLDAAGARCISSRDQGLEAEGSITYRRGPVHAAEVQVCAGARRREQPLAGRAETTADAPQRRPQSPQSSLKRASGVTWMYPVRRPATANQRAALRPPPILQLTRNLPSCVPEAPSKLHVNLRPNLLSSPSLHRPSSGAMFSQTSHAQIFTSMSLL